MGLLEDVQRLQESFQISKRLLDAGHTAFLGLQENNTGFQQLLNAAFTNNQRLINIFEQIEERLSPEETSEMIAAATHLTRTNEVLLQVLKNNQDITAALGDKISTVSQDILALTKAGDQ